MWMKLIVLMLLVPLASIAMADFGIPGEPGTDDEHLDRPRYVRLASNGSMLISDQYRILEVDATGQVVWEVRGYFCDIEWVNETTWAALNGTGAYTCDRIMFSDGRSINLSRDANHLVRTTQGFILAATTGQNWTTEVDLQGNVLHDCNYMQVVDIHPGYFISRYDLYEYDLSTCTYNDIGDVPGSHAMSFYPMPNGSIAYGVGNTNDSNFSVVWGNWSSPIGWSPIDMSWNGTALATPVYYEHYVKVWDFSEPGPSDSDGDGVQDQDDDCPTVWGNATDIPGCPDTDGDGTSDINDPCPIDPLDGCIDSDGDGWNDTVDGCPGTWGNSTVDRLGCPDTDGDGTSDLNDPCPLDPEDRCDDPPPSPELAIISYDWNITDRSARLLVLLNHTCVVASAGGSWSGNNPYRWDRTGLEPNTTYLFQFYFENLTFQGVNRTWLNITDTTLPNPIDPPPELEFTDVVAHPSNRSYLLEFMIYSDECYVVWGTSWTVYSDEIGPSHWFYQYNFSDLLPNYTYTFQFRCVSPDGLQDAWLNHTGTTLADSGDGDGGGDGTDGNTTPDGGGGPGLTDTAPEGIPVTYALLGLVALAGLSAAIFVGAKPEREIMPPRVRAPLPEVPWTDTDLDELEEPLQEVTNPTIPLASPELFDRLPSDPGRMPYLAIQVALAEDLPGILENLRGRVRPQVCDENRVVLKDVGDLEKRLRQLRDDRDIAPRKYEQLLRDVEELKRAVQNLTPLMERRDWDV